jgi:prephenate dehydrogenase
MERRRNYLIAGCNGQFGSVVGKKLKASGAVVWGLDLNESQPLTNTYDRYVQGSISDPNDSALAAVKNADCTILCVPEPVILEALPKILPFVEPGACVADIASVKSRIASVVGDYSGPAGYLSLHPMFAPVDDFSNRNMVVVHLRQNDATLSVMEMIVSWGARITSMSAQEHDHLASYVQVVPHALILTFGRVLSRSGISIDDLQNVATPVMTQMLTLLSRMLVGGDDTYWSIQTDNPFAVDARHEARDALDSLNALCEGQQINEFTELMAQLSSFAGSEAQILFDKSESIDEILFKEIAE